MKQSGVEELERRESRNDNEEESRVAGGGEWSWFNKARAFLELLTVEGRAGHAIAGPGPYLKSGRHLPSSCILALKSNVNFERGF